jgi:hypothetical protein
LTYAALELLRPLIDEKVFKFIAKTRFRMGDFLITPSARLKGDVRVNPLDVAKRLIMEAYEWGLLPERAAEIIHYEVVEEEDDENERVERVLKSI